MRVIDSNSFVLVFVCPSHHPLLGLIVLTEDAVVVPERVHLPRKMLLYMLRFRKLVYPRISFRSGWHRTLQFFGHIKP